ncbi:MAG: c-type cytochrome [Planctomycetota bacterium]|nr:c-type cytochrome [Planctomycetota bacterium]
MISGLGKNFAAEMRGKGSLKMTAFCLVAVILAGPLVAASDVPGHSISGRVVDSAGLGVEGVMVSAIDDEQRKWISVFTKKDGSFSVGGLRKVKHHVRTRLMGLADHWASDVAAGTKEMVIKTRPAVGEELEVQRPANSAFSMLKFENARDKMNFKMMCSYCHQVGTLGFRTPEKPVDWETMLRRMDGFGGLYPHTQETIIERLMNTYKDNAVENWPAFVPPPAPKGAAAAATITMWEMDKPLQGSFHDLEIGVDGKIYAVNISKHRMIVLDPETGTQTARKFPRGTYGPHSIETANDGSLWTTMCATGQMVRYDIGTGQFETYSSAEAPRKRGNYPHTLRINPADPEGFIWYTDAGSNSCYSLHPKTHFVREYRLLSAGQALGAGRGESRGITPYGIDFSPVDGMIWYSKLNGNRIGRIDPKTPDGDIREWNPPFRGPRRLHVAPDGMIWVPGFGSGVFGKFDPVSEVWTVYELPDAENQIPYALNVDRNGIVWICGTHNDTINRFDPRSEVFVEYRLPTRVSYTREIEFDDEGNVWTSTSGPARHMERGVGAVIKISLPKELPETGGVKLVGKRFEGNHKVGNLASAPRTKGNRSTNAELFARIDGLELPKAYVPREHQKYVDATMAALPELYRGQVGRLWNEFRKANPGRKRDGQMFVKILDYVANHRSEFQPKRRFVKKWQHHYFGQAPNHLGNRNVQRGKLVYEQAGCARCHAIGGQGAKYGPDLTDVGKRYQGRKLLDQVVKPSDEIHKEFQTQMVSVDDGRLLTGLVIEENDEEIKMLTNLLKPEKVITLSKGSIEKRKIAELSSMPAGLLDTFQQEEVLDLAGYLQTLKGGKK